MYNKLENIFKDMKEKLEVFYKKSRTERLTILDVYSDYKTEIMTLDSHISYGLKLIKSKQPYYKIYMVCIHIIKDAQNIKVLSEILSEYFFVKAKLVLVLIENTMVEGKKKKYGII